MKKQDLSNEDNNALKSKEVSCYGMVCSSSYCWSGHGSSSCRKTYYQKMVRL